MNEENVKNKIIIPFFQEMGFEDREIDYETSFTIQVGRQTLQIDGEKERASGRLDVLFKENGVNFFIVEVKSESHVFSEDDKKQAISYARLLDQIAPFAVLTNGRITKLYDVMTGEDLSDKGIRDSAYVKNGYTISLDSELKYRALQFFLGLDFDNLRAFCRKQLQLNMQNIKAEVENLERRFVPEIFLRRKGIKEAFDLFLKGEQKVFSIVGESGFGKSNAICDLALECSDTNPTLFFNGANIFREIPSEIASEFNWEFEAQRSGVAILKRITELISQHKRDLIIFIDAIDEAPQKDFVFYLDDFIKHLPEKGIRLCVTSKDSSWPRFLSLSGNPSYMSSRQFLRDKEKNSCSFKVEPFDDEELDIAIAKYRAFYCLPEIKGITRNSCKNPLLLRVLSETYRNQQDISDEIIPAVVVSSFIQKKLEKSEKSKENLSFLSQFGKALFDENSESLYEDKILGTKSVPENLVSFSLLKRSQDDFKRYRISFQYDYIRDFVICFYSLKLDQMDNEQLTNLVSQKIQEELARRVFLYFDKIAKPSQKCIVRKELATYNHMRATAFVTEYQRILEAEFASIRSRFPPYTSGDIGLLVFYNLDPHFGSWCGFREIKSGEEKVIWLEKENWFGELSNDSRMKLAGDYGVHAIFISSEDFINVPPAEYARSQIIHQLKNLIERRLLDESRNIVLSVEYILDMITRYTKAFGLPDFDQNFWNKVFPVSLEKLAEKVDAEINTLYAIALRIGPSASIMLPPELLELQHRIKIVREVQETIDRTFLPFPSQIKIPRLSAFLYNKYTDTELVDYLTKFFCFVFQEFKITVENNFPHLKDSMHTYAILPPRIIGEIDEKNGHKGLTYCVIKGRDSTAVELIVKERESIFDRATHTVHASDGDVKLESYSMASMYLFFEGDSGRDNIIQKHVYELIYEDLRRVFNW